MGKSAENKGILRPAASAVRVAYSLDTSDRWVKDKVKEGVFEGFRIGTSVHVYLDTVQRYLDSVRIVPAAEYVAGRLKGELPDEEKPENN